MRNNLCFSFAIVVISIISCSGIKETSDNSRKSQDIVYKITDEGTLKLRMFRPDNYETNKAYPTIVFYFGGGWNGGTITQFQDQAKYFASRGMISVLADYRVKSRHNTSPFESVKDAKSAIRFLKTNAEKYSIDINKIVASGGSAGGHLAAATSLLSGIDETNEDISVSSKTNALILYNPVIDNSKNGYAYERMEGRYLEFSPMHNITKGAPPTVFFLGDQDKLIPVSTAYEYKNRMEAVGSRCDVFIYKDQAHGFFNKGKQIADKYYLETTREADVFLNSLGFLKGDPTI